MSERITKAELEAIKARRQVVSTLAFQSQRATLGERVDGKLVIIHQSERKDLALEDLLVALHQVLNDDMPRLVAEVERLEEKIEDLQDELRIRDEK